MIKKLDNEIKSELENLIKSIDPLEYFSKFVVPQGEFSDVIRKAILLMLVSDDISGRNRGRLHMLLAGEPGTGKSMIIDWLQDEFNAEYTDANTSKAGMVGDARGKELTEGALAKAHRGILVIDEFEYMEARESLRLAMERGWFKIKKGKIESVVPARVRIVASVNDLSKISPPLLSRFDFIFDFGKPTPEEAKKISQKVLENFFMATTKETSLLQEYVRYVRQFEPQITEENLEKAKKIFEKYFEHKEKGESGRWIASVTRTAMAIAKCYLRDVQPSDFLQALALKDKDLDGLLKMKRELE